MVQPESEITLDSFLKFSMTFLQILQLEFEQKKSNSFAQSVKLFLKINFVRFWLLVIFTANAMVVAHAYLVTSSFTEASGSISNAASIALVAVKASITFWNRDKIWDMLQELQKLFQCRSINKSDYNVGEYFASYSRITNTFLITSVFMILLIPLPILTYLYNGTMYFTVDYWFPFDPYQPLGFKLANLWIILVALISITSLLGCDSLLYALFTVLIIQFDFLKTDFMKLKNMPENKMLIELGPLIDRHNILFDLKDKLQSIYQFAFLFSFVISSLIMCFVAFNLLIAEDVIAAYSFYIPYLALMGGPILLLCVFGQHLSETARLESNKC